jgi:hypothetical protein
MSITVTYRKAQFRGAVPARLTIGVPGVPR